MSTSTGYRRDAAEPSARAGYAGTLKRTPAHDPIRIVHTLSEITGPSRWDSSPSGAIDLTHHHGDAAIGERIIVSGRVLDEDGRSIPHTLLEIWQANAAGRYDHPSDVHDAPLDPHFSGVGRILTDASGAYRITTVRPGAYPWRNHYNAWRPPHLHFSLFGPAFATRLITQMYFPGDPLLELDPIFHSIPDDAARARLVAAFDIGLTVPEHGLGYRFDIVLRGREATPMGI